MVLELFNQNGTNAANISGVSGSTNMSSSSVPVPAEPCNQTVLFYKFPLGTMDDFNEFNDNFGCQSIMAMVKEKIEALKLQRKSAYEMFSSVMKLLFTEELLDQFSFTG